MPCRYDPAPDEIDRSRRITASKKAADEQTINQLSVRVDYLQDLIWRLVHGTDTKPSDEEISTVLAEQDRHRQADLDRLAKVFAMDLTKYKSKLKAVLDADPTKPLQPQLGFDPDEF